MDLINKYALIGNSDFSKRVRMAAIQAAYDVLNDPTKENQHEYSQNVLKNPLDEGWLQPMVISTIQNPTIGTNGNNSTDSDIIFVVNSIYPLFATKITQPNE